MDSPQVKMKLKKVLLRFYRSFHTEYGFQRDAKDGWHPWNGLPYSTTGDILPDLRFVELSVDQDITTIVGANESGKSQILNAISSARDAKSLELEDYSHVDLCHFTSVRTSNIIVYPQVGLVFEVYDIALLKEALKSLIAIPDMKTGPADIALVVLPKTTDSKVAHLWINPNDQPIPLDWEQLTLLRGVLPKVKYIRPTEKLRSHISIDELIANIEKSPVNTRWSNIDRNSLQTSLLKIKNAGVLSNQQCSPEQATTITSALNLLSGESSVEVDRIGLETLLFRDLLGISIDTLKKISKTTFNDRGFVDAQVAKWNQEIDRVLNLQKFWRQDDQFSLRVNYKDSIIYFEITDKTGSVYTFRERSSGLRYFLSYYIQVRAIENSVSKEPSIVIMDEPDSALSVTGQRNLLSVFESLIRSTRDAKNIQLIYTTHSQYLINRNYPSRLRAIRKGDAEEGSQVIPDAHANRYEPIRSALGLENSLSLLYGAANIIVEGSSDQLIICELIRKFSTTENINDYLNLNECVFIPARGAGLIKKMIEQTEGRFDDPPPVVVMFDGDGEGRKQRELLCSSKKHNYLKEVSGVLSDILDENAVTSEDILPASIYLKSLHEYLKETASEWYEKNKEALVKALPSSDNIGGLADKIKKALKDLGYCEDGKHDKVLVAEKTISLMVDDEAATLVSSRLKKICAWMNQKVEIAKERHSARMVYQSLRRLSYFFLISNRQEVTLVELEQHIKRMRKEAEALGDYLKDVIDFFANWLAWVESLRVDGKSKLFGVDYGMWTAVWSEFHNEPFEVAQKAMLTLGKREEKAVTLKELTEAVVGANKS